MDTRHLLIALTLALLSNTLSAAELEAGEHWFAATLGHRDAEFTILVHQPRSGEPQLRVLDLDELHLAYSPDRRLRHAGENYVPASALTDHEAHLDPLTKRAHFVTRVRPHIPENTPPDLLLDVRINGVLIDQPLYVKNTGSDLFLPEESLEQLRVALPDAYGPFLASGMPVHALAGEQFYLALDRLYLEMTIPADRYATTRVTAGKHAQPAKITDWSPAMVFGYNISGGEDAAGERWHAGLGDLAISSGTVTCRSLHFAQSTQDGTTRLNSSCLADWPDLPLSAGIGDNFTAPGTLAQTVAYGGFWIGTDYSLQPYRNLQPSLIVDGNARLPSTLEIWMDQRLGLRQDIPPGPFLVDNLPAVTGSGELRAVLVDATGQRVLVSAPVYSDPRLLQPGIIDWRVEAGRLRPGGGNDVYTEQFASGTARTGITRWLTGEVHAESTEAFSTWNAGIVTRIGRLGLLELGASGSRTETDDRQRYAEILGYSYRGDYVHAAVREIRRDRGYVSLGYPLPGEAPELERTATLGVSAGRVSLALSGIERVFEDADAGQRFGNASLSIGLGNFGQLLLTATRNLSDDDSDPVYAAQLSLPLGRRSLAYHTVSDGGDAISRSTGYHASPPSGSGVGYRVNRDSVEDNERYFAEATYRGNAAVVSASGQRNDDGSTSWGARTSGAVIASRGGAGFARDDGNSFAVVNTGAGMNGVTIRRDNQDVALTNSSGTAIVSGLRPYQSNHLALRIDELPLASEIERNELAVVPGRRGVVVADYAVREPRQLLARLKPPAQGDLVIPPGSQVLVAGVPAGLVGFDGTIYVELPQGEHVAHVVIEVRWAQGRCMATASPQAVKGVQDLGEITCYPG